jgi:hypothetical protein
MPRQRTTGTGRPAQPPLPRTGWYLVGALMGLAGAVLLTMGAPAGFGWALIVFGAGVWAGR